MDLVFAHGDATLSQILEGKGQLKHRQEGREFIYTPVHSRAEVGAEHAEPGDRDVFGGSLAQAQAAYLSDPGTKLSEGEVEEMRRLLDGVERGKVARKG